MTQNVCCFLLREAVKSFFEKSVDKTGECCYTKQVAESDGKKADKLV